MVVRAAGDEVELGVLELFAGEDEVGRTQSSFHNAAGNTGVERRRQFDKHAILQYRLMLGLFSHRLSRKYFREVHGVNLDRTLMKEMLALRVAGAIKDDPNDPDNIIVTDGGKFLGLVMMKAFYSAMDNVRAELRQPLKEEDYS